MATATDLPGMLRNDDDNLTVRISEWISNLVASELPGSIRLHWKPTGMTSEELLEEIPVSTVPTSAAVLVEEVAKAIRAKLGAQPEGGSLRVRVAKKNKKNECDIDMQRKLVVGQVDNDANVAMVRQENERLRGENAELRRQNVEFAKVIATMAQSAGLLNAEQAKAIVSLATTRATAGTANEMAGLTTFLGLLTLYFFWPHIKHAMGLDPGAGLKEVIDTGRKMLAGESGDRHMAHKILPPPGASRRELPTEPKIQPSAEPEIPPGADEFVQRLQSDLKFRRDVASQVMNNPDLLSQLQNAALEGAP